MNNRFSQRIGKTPAFKNMQIENIDSDLRNSLWNLIKMHFLDEIKDFSDYGSTLSDFKDFAKLLWHDFYKLPIDTISSQRYINESYIRDKYFGFLWYQIYDFIEFLIHVQENDSLKDKFINSINLVLEREFSGYRIVNEKVAPISNQLEFDEINLALENTLSLSALEGANIHLTKSLDFISDKKNPDYRNSIKESISAVESSCRIITGENTLGKALNKLESKGLSLNKQLKAGFDKIYAYTNDKDNGIRHAIVTSPTEPDFSDAKYMIISCSAFINYLVNKAEKIGIEFK